MRNAGGTAHRKANLLSGGHRKLIFHLALLINISTFNKRFWRAGTLCFINRTCASLQTVSGNFMTTHKTVFDNDFQVVESDKEFTYQTTLTAKFDKGMSIFDQEVINEIVLWKVNRYAVVDEDTLKLLNNIDSNATKLDGEMTRIILKALLKNKGIQLPMASTILRFKNKNIYQIIDQRVYRIIYKDDNLKLKTHINEKNLNDQVDLYLKYLKDLRNACEKNKIPFDKSDRILFMADKRINKNVLLENYSNKTKNIKTS